MKLIFRITLAAIVLTSPHGVLALDPLQEVNRSQEMDDFERTWNSDDLLGPRWLKENSNFGELFLIPRSALNLIMWIAPSRGNFIHGYKDYSRSKEYIMSEQLFRSPNLNELSVQIYLPHPKFVPLLAYRLVPDLADLQPPSLEVEKQEKLTIQSYPADLYYHTQKGLCSLLIQGLAKNAMINIIAKGCSASEISDLKKLGEVLDLKRLNKKLET